MKKDLCVFVVKNMSSILSSLLDIIANNIFIIKFPSWEGN